MYVHKVTPVPAKIDLQVNELGIIDKRCIRSESRQSKSSTQKTKIIVRRGVGGGGGRTMKIVFKQN